MKLIQALSGPQNSANGKRGLMKHCVAKPWGWMAGSVSAYGGVSLGKGDVYSAIHPLWVLHQGGPSGVEQLAHSQEAHLDLA